MKITLSILIFIISCSSIFAQYPDGNSILDKMDKNMSSKNQVVKAKMIVHGRRASRTMEMKSWSVGDKQSFTEYLSPAREAGTKMLKLEDKLWIYSPSTDRIIQISGHMLRQSMMGSDLSYEDMMNDEKMRDKYNAEVIFDEVYQERKCWVLEMTAKVDDVAYFKRKVWVDTERYIPLKEELFAKSGKLLKKTELSNVKNINGRWYPMKVEFKDMLKSGGGTEFIVDEIQFNVRIPENLFTKGSLK